MLCSESVVMSKRPSLVAYFIFTVESGASEHWDNWLLPMLSSGTFKLTLPGTELITDTLRCL